MDRNSVKKKYPLEKKSLRLVAGDAEIIDEHYPRAGHNVVIREVVHKFVRQLQENVNRKEMPDVGSITITID